MILSPNRSSRNGAKVRLIAVHSAEGARDRISLGKYFQGPVDASSHVGIDAGGVEQYVPYNEKAWTLLNGNPISENAELCAFARWSRAQWLSEGTVDGVVNPKRMLDNAAVWIRERCLANGIPIRKIDAAAIKRGEAGVIGHVDWTNTGDGNHTDPGPNFPWDYVMARAAGNQEGEDEMSVNEFLDTVIPQEFSPENGKALGIKPDANGKYIKGGTSLRVLFAWSDNRHESLKAELAEAQRELAEVKEKVTNPAPAPVAMTEADRVDIASKVVGSMAGIVKNTMQTMQVNTPASTSTFSPKPPSGQ